MGRHRSPPAFFLLVFVLSLPFLVLSALRPQELLPGLPVAALMVVCPAVAASLLVYREQGAHAAHGVAVRQRRPERLRGHPLSHHQQSLLAALSQCRSDYDPRRTAVLILLAAAIVTLAWGPGTQTRAHLGTSGR
jgi:hypothetical protein